MSMHLKNGMKMMTAALLLALAAGMAGCGGGEKKDAVPAAGKTYKVGIVQLVEHSRSGCGQQRVCRGAGQQRP